MSATETYRSGRFDATLLKMLANYDAVKAIILPTLGPERRATYSPFLPISPRTGVVLQVPTIARDPAGRHDHLRRSRHRRGNDDAGHRRPREVPVEGGLGAPLGGARRRLRDVGKGPDRFGHACRRRSARRSAARRPTVSTTSSSSTRRARRSRSRRGTASPSSSGSPTPRRKACRSSCTRSRARRSGSTST